MSTSHWFQRKLLLCEFWQQCKPGRSWYLTPHVVWGSQTRTGGQGGPKPASPQGSGCLSILLSDLCPGADLWKCFYFICVLFKEGLSTRPWASSSDPSMEPIISIWALALHVEIHLHQRPQGRVKIHRVTLHKLVGTERSLAELGME